MAVVAAVALMMTGVASAAFADGGNTVQIQDKCDAATFNAALGPGACDPRAGGDVTFAEFLSKLNPNDGGHHDWRFSSTTLGIKAGDSVHVANTGGETHTFTEVSRFGTGIVPPLNAALPAGTLPALPLAALTFLPSGQMLDLTKLGLGQHNFQCMIHPWMRTVVTVQPND